MHNILTPYIHIIQCVHIIYIWYLNCEIGIAAIQTFASSPSPAITHNNNIYTYNIVTDNIIYEKGGDLYIAFYIYIIFAGLIAFWLSSGRVYLMYTSPPYNIYCVFIICRRRARPRSTLFRRRSLSVRRTRPSLLRTARCARIFVLFFHRRHYDFYHSHSIHIHSVYI